VGYLLDEIRLNGESQELIDEIVLLSRRYGIITPYTSFLILEDNPSGDSFDALRDETGERAVSAANDIGSYRDADNPTQVISELVRYVGNKTFFMRDSFWVDVEYSGDEAITDIEFAAEDYFELLRSRPELGPYFALGKNVVVSSGDRAYKVHEPGLDYTEVPADFVLFPNYPNPFNPGTNIEYFLNRDTHVRISIYDILGRQVRVLEDAVKSTGPHLSHWDGKNSMGAEVASGVYFYRLSTERSAQVRKMAKVK
jgi:hypothetical protein